MIYRRLTTAMLISASLIAGTITAYAYQDLSPRKPKLIKRAKRPSFKERDWNGIYFENMFQQGLVGDRPSPQATPPVVAAGSPPPAMAPTTPDTSNEAFAWSRSLDSSVIEDEVKVLQQHLVADITTPGRFKSDYGKIHQSYSMLSMLFGIIIEYDGDIRWKKEALQAQPAFARAAANSRVGSVQAYNNAKIQKENLTELVRGGGFNDQQKPVETVDWPNAVYRGPIMAELEDSLAKLKPHLANKTEFTQNMESVYHGASLIAAMGNILCKTDMDDADEEDYANYAKEMTSAALQVTEGCRTNNYDLASKGFNLIEQSCSNCHDDWR